MWYGDILDENDIERFEDIRENLMIINTPISLGELLDKISILIIKEKNIRDIEKQKHIKKELAIFI